MNDKEKKYWLDQAGAYSFSCSAPVNIGRGRGMRACGKCDACLYSRQQRLASEIQHEIDAAGGASFFTGTYKAEPETAKQWQRDAALFRKQFRNLWVRSGQVPGRVPRMFTAYELGEGKGRAHIHCLVFTSYASFAGQLLERAWPHGRAQSRVQFPGDGRAGNYVAGYCVPGQQMTPAMEAAKARLGGIPRAAYPRGPSIGRGVSDQLIANLKASPHALARWKQIGAPVRLVRRVKDDNTGRVQAFTQVFRKQTVKRVRDALLSDLEKARMEQDRARGVYTAREAFGLAFESLVSRTESFEALRRRKRIGREGHVFEEGG